MITIRLATFDDMPKMLEVYAYARKFMAENGNPHQWGDSNHPSLNYLKDGIDLGELHVVIEDDKILACFELSFYDDPDYKNINGKWLNDESYVAIHTLASNEGVRGMFDYITNYVKERYDNIKMDTHEDNKIMQHLLTSRGFKYCGIVTLSHDKTQRLAYQYIKNNSLYDII